MSDEVQQGVRHLLAVEDEPDHLMAVEMIFRGLPGYVIHGAADTREAEAILESQPIDLVLLDLALPREDGITFCKRIKSLERYRDLKIIAFSAFPRQIYEDRAREAGCIEYVDKPFHPRELVELVRRHAPPPA
jgi:CheY-like chemotaxis protein